MPQMKLKLAVQYNNSYNLQLTALNNHKPIEQQQQLHYGIIQVNLCYSHRLILQKYNFKQWNDIYTGADLSQKIHNYVLKN